MSFFVILGVVKMWAAGHSLLVAANPVPCIQAARKAPLAELVSPLPINDLQLQQVAKAITVKVQSATVTGSGVLISRRGPTYRILTNAHNLLGTDYVQAQTSDGAWHQARRFRASELGNNDLALLEFTSNQSYQLAAWSDRFIAKQGLEIVAVGFEFDRPEITISSGRVSRLLDLPLKQGYQLGYHSRLRQGMSGGPILDLAGQLVGVNAMSAYPIVNSAYIFTDGSRPSWPVVKQLRKSNWGIPIHPYAECLQQIH